MILPASGDLIIRPGVIAIIASRQTASCLIVIFFRVGAGNRFSFLRGKFPGQFHYHFHT